MAKPNTLTLAEVALALQYLHSLQPSTKHGGVNAINIMVELLHASCGHSLPALSSSTSASWVSSAGGCGPWAAR